MNMGENTRTVPKYTTLLPYLTFNYDLGNIEAGLSLREYIERPSYASLGNVTTYTSSKTRWQGNPYLESTQTFDINMDLMYRELMVSLGAQFIKNGISRSTNLLLKMKVF